MKKEKRGEEAAFTTYVRIEGRMTIPLAVRNALGIKRGDLVECRIRKVEGKEAE